MADPTAVEAAELYRSIRDAEDKLSRILGAEQVLITRIRTTHKALQRKAMLHVLETTSLDELNRDGQGIPVATLRKAGYENVRQLAELSVKQLDDLAGIGDSTLDKVILRVQEIARHANEVARVRIEERTPDTEQLVRNATIMQETEELIRQAAENTFESGADSKERLAELERMTSPMTWRTMPEAEKDRSRMAYSIISAWQETGKPDRIRGIFTEFAEREKGLTVDGCWERFQQNTAPVYAVLDRLVGVSGPASQGLPEEIVKEIDAYPLDTSLMVATLRNYQEFGTKYILHQKRTLLGDEMGLGKTMQALAAIAHLSAEKKTHFLVVCPVSVMINWTREIAQHTKLTATMIYGNDREEEFQEWVRSGGIAVTTFETVTKITPPEGMILDLLVVDEAHYVKNPEAERTKGLIRFAAAAEMVLFMTGTPLENRVDEMIFLISMLNTEKAEEIRGMKELSMAPEFREKVAPVYLRRTREDVLKELPEKVEKEEWCRLGAKELAVYKESLAEGNFSNVRRVSWNVGQLTESAKAARLLEIADQARDEGRKIIVFSFFLETIRKVQELLGDRVYGPISGSIPAEKRQELVDRFGEGPDGSVLLCQIVAGGVGLNIQSASVVVICEPQWKPSTETQAISRVYRMGQARSVEVFRLLAEDTVDEHVLQILKGKSEIFSGFADESSVGDASMELLERVEKNVMAKILEEERKKYGVAAEAAGNEGETENPGPEASENEGETETPEPEASGDEAVTENPEPETPGDEETPETPGNEET